MYCSECAYVYVCDYGDFESDYLCAHPKNALPKSRIDKKFDDKLPTCKAVMEIKGCRQFKRKEVE